MNKRTKLTRELYSAYKNLNPRTRALFGVGLMCWAGIGLLISPQVEKALDMVPTEEEKRELERKLDFRVVSVDREKRGGDKS